MPKPDYKRVAELREAWMQSKKVRRNLFIARGMAYRGMERAEKRDGIDDSISFCMAQNGFVRANRKIEDHGDNNSNLARIRMIVYLMHGEEMTEKAENRYRITGEW